MSGTEGHVTPSCGGGEVTKSVEGNINLNLECMFGNVRKTQGPAGATCRSQEAHGAHLLWAQPLTLWFGGSDRSRWVHQVQACPQTQNWTLGLVQP